MERDGIPLNCRFAECHSAPRHIQWSVRRIGEDVQRNTARAHATRPSTATPKSTASPLTKSRCSFGRTAVSVAHCPERRAVLFRPAVEGQVDSNNCCFGNPSFDYDAEEHGVSAHEVPMLFREDGGNWKAALRSRIPDALSGGRRVFMIHLFYLQKTDSISP